MTLAGGDVYRALLDHRLRAGFAAYGEERAYRVTAA